MLAEPQKSGVESVKKPSTEDQKLQTERWGVRDHQDTGIHISPQARSS